MILGTDADLCVDQFAFCGLSVRHVWNGLSKCLKDRLVAIHSIKYQYENQRNSSPQPELCATACCIQLMICLVTSC